MGSLGSVMMPYFERERDENLYGSNLQEQSKRVVHGFLFKLFGKLCGSVQLFHVMKPKLNFQKCAVKKCFHNSRKQHDISKLGNVLKINNLTSLRIQFPLRSYSHAGGKSDKFPALYGIQNFTTCS